jgi:3-dehydroquinate synthase
MNDIINVHTIAKDYKIYIGEDILEELLSFIEKADYSNKSALVTNSTVYPLYGKRIEEVLKNRFEVFTYILPDGEEYKNIYEFIKITDFLAENNLDRKSPLFALGGGVIGDIAGFAASTFLRGIPLIHIPTTLLAQVDSSIGGKVAINHKRGKNLIGAFYQPDAVFSGIGFLHTLPDREWKAAMAEVIKYGVIRDEELFSYMEKNVERILKREEEAVFYIVRKSILNKVSVIEEDEKEKGLRQILNFGHTLAHALEKIGGYKTYRHGEAVAVGMVFASLLSWKLNICKKQVYERIRNILQSFSLPTHIPLKFETNSICDTMSWDKKVVSDKLRFVLTENIGKVRIITDLELQMIVETINELKG